MNACPYCQAKLSHAALQQDSCPRCGKPLRTSRHDRTTVDLDQLPPGTNSDSILTSPAPASAQLGATIDSSKIAQTLDSVDLPLQPNTGAGNATVDLSALQASGDSDSFVLPPTPPAGSNLGATVDASRIAATLDSVDLPLPSGTAGANATIDVAGFSDRAKTDAPVVPPQVPPESKLGATIVDGRITQTLDSVDLPLGAGTGGPNATVDLASLTPSADSNSLEIGPRTPAGRKTVDDSKVAQTIDSVDLEFGASSPPAEPEQPRNTDSSLTDSRFAQTLDSVDMPSVTGEKGTGTVSDRRLDATIDSVNLDSSLAAAKSPGSDTRLDQTLDSTALPSPPPGSGTVHDRRLNQTIESDSVSTPNDKPGTIVDRQVNATLDSTNVPASTPGAGTVHERGGQATYDSAAVSGEDVKQVDRVWHGADVEKASPRMTIKGREPNLKATRTSLVIQPRRFREAKTPEPVVGSDADYDLLKMLGQGGMGVVYAARQASIDRTVAIKMLKPDMARDEGQRNKFLAEAVITGDLDHPNIVPIYDLGKNREGALFYAMKKVQGTPWDRVIQKKSLSENLEILLKVADAVAFAHNRHVVHRDLKPENIMLGDFGEVLVMDWGLALPYGNFEKSRSIQPSVGMGGTPAYMAPEMATGPFDKIGPTSDIYLLGAILYEIVAGKPPHTGRDVMKCLFAAAKNEIQPTEKTGELLDIALKAMSTRQQDRYQTVQEFQAALREYQAHSASIAMSARAEEALERAQKYNDYDTFAQAVFEFQEALTLWPKNSKAASGVSRAKRAYAESALAKGDLDLAESLLDEQDPTHSDALIHVAEAKREREAKQLRLQANRRLIRTLVTTFVITVTAGLVVVSYQSYEVAKQRDAAHQSAEEAKRQKDFAETEKEKALDSEKKANVARDIAQKAREDEEQQRRNAEKQQLIAEANERRAKEAEVIARKERDNANYAAYVALIGLAAARIEENAFDYARELLNTCSPELRNWEWGRLMYLCEQSYRDVKTDANVESIAFSRDGQRFATAGWNGLAQVFSNSADGKLISTMKHGGTNVYAVAFSPTGHEIATGSNDPAGFLTIWNADTGKVIRQIPGHEQTVTSVAYSQDGRRLLTASTDKTARLWDVETGQLIKTFAGHTWWVWSAAFSPDEKQIVTASHDGTALVWSVETGEHLPPFMGHEGPVYAATFSPSGEHVVTGGYDKRVLLWKPGELKPFDYAALVSGAKPPMGRYQALEGHLAAVRTVKFSKDGKLIVSAGHDNTVKVWSAESAQLVKTLRGHDKWVRSCDFAPDSNWVISAGYDSFARLWDIEGYEEARVLQGRWLRGHEDAVMAVAFSPQGDQVVTASRDRTARAWDPRTGQPTISFEEGHSFLASTATFYPGGQRLATAAVDNSTRIWDVTTGVQHKQLFNTGRAATLAVSHNGKWLLTGGNQTGDEWIAQLWDADEGQLLHQLAGHSSQVTAVAFSPDDQFCFTGDSNGRGLLWQLQPLRVVARLQWHTSKISVARFLDDGQRLITASDDKTVAQWDTARLSENPASVKPMAKLTLRHDESVLSLDIVSDQRLAITSTLSGAVQLWDLDRAVVLRSLPVGTEKTNSVSLSPDGRLALTVQPEDNLVRLWDVRNGREILLPPPNGGPAGAFLDLNAVGGVVWSAIFSLDGEKVVTIGGNEAKMWDARAEVAQRPQMSFSPHAAVVSVGYSSDGARLVTGSWDGTARIWNARTGQAELKLVGGHTAYVNSAVFSPKGEFVLTTSDDQTAKLWDATTGQVVRIFSGHTDAVRFGVFSPDGTKVLTASEDKTARIWDTQTAALILELRGHEWGVRCAAFSKDGQFVVTGSQDNSARLWNVERGEVVWVLSGHTAEVTSVAYAPDGKRILTASGDFTAKLWDAETGKEILNLKGHTQELTSVAFSQDGRFALTGSQDGTAIMWIAKDWNEGKPVPQAVASRSNAALPISQ